MDDQQIVCVGTAESSILIYDKLPHNYHLPFLAWNISFCFSHFVCVNQLWHLFLSVTSYHTKLPTPSLCQLFVCWHVTLSETRYNKNQQHLLFFAPGFLLFLFLKSFTMYIHICCAI